VEEMIKNHFEAQFEEAHHERDSYGRLSSDRKNCIFGLCGVSAFHRKTHSVVVTCTSEQQKAWLYNVSASVSRYFPRRGNL
jgi:hypothetical protein